MVRCQGSNNTNKLSPQELISTSTVFQTRSNNTNKLSPQELLWVGKIISGSSNNTNKLSPQEPSNHN